MTNTNIGLGDRDEGNYNDGQYTLIVPLWQFIRRPLRFNMTVRSTVLQLVRKMGLEAKYRRRMQEFNLIYCPQVTILWNSTGRTNSGKSKNWSPRPEFRLTYWLSMCKTVIPAPSLHMLMYQTLLQALTEALWPVMQNAALLHSIYFSSFFLFFYF